MSRRYCYDYPRPAVTADLVTFAREGPGAPARVLLIRRGRDPFAGSWALPGGFVEIDEPLEDAARRELKEETGVIAPAALAFLGVYGDPGRDPRGRTISVAYAALIEGAPPRPVGSDDAREASWHDPAEPLTLAFDHDQILRAGLSWLRRQRPRKRRPPRS